MFELKKLPFDLEKFDKKLSIKSFQVHHGLHHQAYINNLNEFIKGYEMDLKMDDALELELIPIMKKSYLKFNNNIFRKIYNNAAQVWNHDFFWASIWHEKKDVSSKMIGLIEKDFGSLDAFKEEFYQKGSQLFGSGWVWLIWECQKGKISIMQTENAINPIVLGEFIPLLVCDVWEHAYYIDYLNKRVDYLKIIIENLNWEFAQKNLDEII